MVRMLRSPMAPTIERLRLRTAAGRRFVLRVRRGSRGPHVRGIRRYRTSTISGGGSDATRGARVPRRVQQVLDTLGISRHPDKGVWEPTQRPEHLGLDVDTRDGLSLRPAAQAHRADAAGAAARRAAAADTRLVKTRTLAAFIGYAQSVSSPSRRRGSTFARCTTRSQRVAAGAAKSASNGRRCATSAGGSTSAPPPSRARYGARRLSRRSTATRLAWAGAACSTAPCPRAGCNADATEEDTSTSSSSRQCTRRSRPSRRRCAGAASCSSRTT